MDGEQSEIDDPSFFLAHDGRNSPKAELIATIHALYNESSLDDNATACRYPARKHWLQEELHLKDLPHVECTEYDAIIKRVDPQSATLVFPSAHINSPASMFGHTFVRINSSYRSRLLAYAINYAADADPSKENGVVFAFKGLFGGYNGKFSLLPYYDKLKEYRDTENRDIWEYDLNLSKEETMRMLEHIWEIKDTRSSYFFFTNNCSYEMLWLIEVARPSVHLREHFKVDVIPLETVHVAKEEGLLGSTHYRPSKRTIIEAYKPLLGYKEVQLAKQLAKGTQKPAELTNSKLLSKEKKRYILEVAIELTQYYYQHGELDKEHYLDIFHTLTSLRSRLGRAHRPTPKRPPNPLEGHRTARIDFGIGSMEGEDALLFGWRGAYHSLDDPLYGFLRGTQIEFLALQAYATKERLFLDEATLLSIESIAQVDSFFENFSWRTNIGYNKEYLDDKSRFNFSVGAGYSLGNSLGYVYFLVDPQLHYASKIVGAVDVSTGFVIDAYNKHTNLQVEYKHKWYDTGHTQNILKASQTLRLQQNTALKLEYRYIERTAHFETDYDKNSILFYVNCYF